MRQKTILWVDCLGGLFVGALVLLLHAWISELEGLPVDVVLFMAAANLAYGSYSLFVTTRSPRPLKFVNALAIANMAWLLVCLAIAYNFRNDMTLFGFAHVLGEGFYVAALGWTEWSLRHNLSGS